MGGPEGPPWGRLEGRPLDLDDTGDVRPGVGAVFCVDGL